MKNLAHWLLALLALTAIANLGGAFTPQEPPKPEKKIEKPLAKKIQNKNRSNRQNAIRAVMPSLKTTLGEAVALAEKETGGKAFSAGVEITAGKPSLQVNLFVGDKLAVTEIDHETKKVTVVNKKAEGEEGHENGDEGGEEGG
jgi:hypothetical protein